MPFIVIIETIRLIIRGYYHIWRFALPGLLICSDGKTNSLIAYQNDDFDAKDAAKNPKKIDYRSTSPFRDLFADRAVHSRRGA